VITNIEDLRVLARKRVPRMFYDYADSGSWTESTYRANEADFHKIKLRQRVAVNMESRSTAVKMVRLNTTLWPLRSQAAPAARAISMTIGTKYPETTSASCAMGALEPCACSTSLMIWARAVSARRASWTRTGRGLS